MKFTVAKKMMFLIFTAIVGLVGLAVMGSMQMTKVFETTNYTNVSSVPSLIDLDQARKHVLRLRIQLNRFVLNTDPKIEAEALAKIEEHNKATRASPFLAIVICKIFVYLNFSAHKYPFAVASVKREGEGLRYYNRSYWA